MIVPLRCLLKVSVSFLMVFVTLGLLMSVPVQAAITPVIERQASGLMRQGKARQAYALLRRHHTARGAGPQQWFILGLAGYRAGDFATAETAFRNVLAQQPNSQRAKLELARVLQRRGQSQAAEQLFRDVRSQNPPAQVAANIDRFLSMMQNRNNTGHAYRARATIGVGYDSNVNQATRAHSVNLFGLAFILNRDARQRGAGFGFFKGEFDHIYRFDRHFAWATSLSFTAKRHFGENDFDSYNVTAATGPVLQPGNRTTIMLPVFVNLVRFENSAMPFGRRFYTNEFGVAPQFRYALTKSLDFNLTGVLSRRHYFEQTGRSANVLRTALGFDFKTPGSGTFSAALTMGRELADRSIYSNRSKGARIGWQYAFARHLVVSVHGTYDDIQYDARELIYQAIRHDHKWMAGLDAVYRSELLGGDVMLSYAHTWNRSNLAIFQYERDVLSLGYRKAF